MLTIKSSSLWHSRDQDNIDGSGAGGPRTTPAVGGDAGRPVAAAAELPPEPRVLSGDARHHHRVEQRPQVFPAVDHHGGPLRLPHRPPSGTDMENEYRIKGIILKEFGIT